MNIMTRKKAAATLGVREPAITTFIARGWLTGVRIGRHWRVHATSVERLLREGTPSVSGSCTVTLQASQPATAHP